nr:hypothetical protein [Tanacetum cinerariifolium]
MPSKDNEEESTESDFDDENASHVAGSLAKSSKKKKLRKFDFVTKSGDHVHLTKEQINAQKKIKKEAKAEVAKQEGENDLANKKKKHADDIYDYFRANKRLKSSIQYEDHPARMMMNEPVPGMIMFNSYDRQDFVTIEDFRDYPNEMLRTIQEIFFRLHQGLQIDDHARTFSSLLLAEVDKRI